MALLDADVNFKVARDFIERVKEKAIGLQVIQSIKPGEQVVKIIHDELVDLLGASNAGLQQSRQPSCILMVGLHGSGKTTSLATMMAAGAMCFLGGPVLFGFAISIMFGIIIGTYSSIFVAAPMLIHLPGRLPGYKYQNTEAAAKGTP